MSELQIILDSLEKEERDRLYYAFEEGLEEYIIYQPGKYIGVNITNKSLIPIYEEGVWSYGTISLHS